MKDSDDQNEMFSDWSEQYFDVNKNKDEEDESEYDEEGRRVVKTKYEDEDEEAECSDVEVDEDEDYIKSQIDTGSINSFNKERVSELTGKIVVNYVDNDTFCNAVVGWNNACVIAKTEGKENPPMPNLIGEQILKMVDGLSRRYNFRNYTYIDEMKEDAIYMATRSVKNYDPAKSNNNNAFGYFNFVMWRAMLTRIKIEKKQNDIKMNMLKDPMYLGYTSETSNNGIDKDKMLSFYE